MNTTKLLIIIICMSIAVISSWMFLIVPDLKNSTKFFEINVEAEGIWLLLDSIESMQYTEYHVRSNFFQEVIQENDNLLEIKSTWIGKDIVLNDVLWESEQVVFVEKNSRKDIEFNSYYAFPYNTQKQSYEFWNFGDKPYSLHFEKLVNFNGVELYEFSSFDTYDISGGYTKFPDEQIFTDDKTVFWVEPSTGLIVGIDTKFSDYAIKDGQKIIFGEGTETTTEYSKTILTEQVKNQINLFYFYEVIIPIFLTIIFVGIFIGTFLHLMLKSKEIEKISTNVSAKLLTMKEIDRQKEEFASMVTHELKTPLTPIRGYCEMLKDENFGTLTKDQIYYVEKINSNAMILERLICDVLAVQKLDMGKMSFNKESVNVCDFLDRLKQDSACIMKDKGIELVVTNSVKATLKTDQLRLRQILDNLIRNSVDFVPTKNGKIEVGAKQENGKIIFHVKDNGIGVPKDKQQNIFKKFYQVDTSHTRKHGGTGLGLVICRGIVNALGGEIWFESEPGKETTFYFSVPIYNEKITTESTYQ